MSEDPRAQARRVASELFAVPATAPAGRPLVRLMMIQSLDGAISLDGRSGGLGNAVDQAVMMALRARSDAVLVGSETVRIEGYGRPLPDVGDREERAAWGATPEPLIVVLSRALSLPVDRGLLADAEATAIVLTESDDLLDGAAAQVHYLRERPHDLAGSLVRLGEQWGVGEIVCEGGPGLNAVLLELGLVDEIVVAIAPLLAPAEPARGIVAAAAEGRYELTPLAQASAAGMVWLRYGCRPA